MELRSAQKEWKCKGDAKKAYQNIPKDTKNMQKYTKSMQKYIEKCIKNVFYAMAEEGLMTLVGSPLSTESSF